MALFRMNSSAGISSFIYYSFWVGDVSSCGDRPSRHSADNSDNCLPTDNILADTLLELRVPVSMANLEHHLRGYISMANASVQAHRTIIVEARRTSSWDFNSCNSQHLLAFQVIESHSSVRDKHTSNQFQNSVSGLCRELTWRCVTKLVAWASRVTHGRAMAMVEERIGIPGAP